MPTSNAILVDFFDQILTGEDIPVPSTMLKIKAEKAAILPEHAPYSVLTNLAHAVLWQELWLQKLHGKRKASGMQEWQNDFRIPEPSEFGALRTRFLDGLAEAREIARTMSHSLDSDEAACHVLLTIGIHASYHLGQMKCLLRITKTQAKDKLEE